jgi:hypothetical protein
VSEFTEGFRGGFTAEDALESRVDELHADQSLAIGQLRAHVHHAALRLETFSARSAGEPCRGELICRFEPMATSKRVRKRSATTAQIFAGSVFLEGKAASAFPQTRNGKRPDILRSDLCWASFSLVWLMGGCPQTGRFSLEEALHVLDNFRRRTRHMYDLTQFAAIPYTMGKPTGELFHFSHGVR